MRIVIIGAGQAGMQVASSLRQNGFGGDLVLIGDEQQLPYQRPPLSKAFIKRQVEPAGLLLRSAAALAEQRIDLLIDSRVTRIDRDAQLVQTNDRTVGYDYLVMATGARARNLQVPGSNLAGVMSLRSISDALTFRSALECAHQVAIVGGGFIGLEVAATAAAMGKSVTVIEGADRVMARAVAPLVSSWLEAMHSSMGTRILKGHAVASLGGCSRVQSVRLTNGDEVRADLVLVGVGGVPNVEIAKDAGLECPNGITVNEFGQTSDPRILAAGDCTLHPNRFAGGEFRLESVQNAIDQAKTVAGALLGDPKPYDSVPWFWSDQGSVKLQTTGLPIGTESYVTRGDPESGRFTVFHLKGGRVIAADSINSPADHMCARRLVAANHAVTAETLRDPNTDLKSLLLQKAA
ncbi:NAD(P)/FAD-dependent oxidoreductase [Aminobacter ciceronei]|uniref:3-phenylpropionate/trans-cinnamate dioxygenase ferredoxin reductase subunit n=1 Tax=Aminobacter ciceronei TaxID=150723 RepID=A0ABR6CG73_9HYPH|nr:FAD-dependent oxidoreductase [Aminobacter ciceronei]MBA8909934.1 3-phenylpropionate/trans-cinnamate dioxygenase ferredoxin reductase subunit [Aminobacter ciceronei]MBA9023706.1 3-phenylpropionate/trans-cinnamate dioxygenase ferredoxin reductase subunit [Aminobacter ciceronei]